MLSPKEIQDTVKQLFDSENFISDPVELYEPIQYTLGLGGKRLRPTLLLAACDMFGGDIGRASEAAVGIEVFHNFTLLHDDLMDKSPLRRCNETVYRRSRPEFFSFVSGHSRTLPPPKACPFGVAKPRPAVVRGWPMRMRALPHEKCRKPLEIPTVMMYIKE